MRECKVRRVLLARASPTPWTTETAHSLSIILTGLLSPLLTSLVRKVLQGQLVRRELPDLKVLPEPTVLTVQLARRVHKALKVQPVHKAFKVLLAQMALMERRAHKAQPEPTELTA